LIFVCLIFASSFFVTKPQPQITQSQIIKDKETITTQTSRIIAGEPVKWTAIVKSNSINTNQKYIKLPQGAENIKVKAITKNQAKQIVNQQISQTDLTTKERQALANQSTNKSIASIRKFSNLLFASLEEATTQVVEQITEAIPFLPQEETIVVETPTETVVDVSEVVENVQDVETETITEELVEPETLIETSVDSSPSLREESEANDEAIPAVESPIEEQIISEIATPSSVDEARNDTAETPLETLDPDQKEYVKVEYETQAPEITEEKTKKGKLVTISSTEEKVCEKYKSEATAEAPSYDGAIVSFFSNVGNLMFASLEDAVSQVVEQVVETVVPIPEVVEVPAETPASAESSGEAMPAETPTDSSSSLRESEPAGETDEAIPTVESPAEEKTTPEIATPSSADEARNDKNETPSPEQEYQDCLDSQPELTNVLAFTTIPEIYSVGQEDRIKIKWKSNNNQSMAFTATDTNNNGMLDYVEWTVPHLSEQIFEIIFITKALHLDKNLKVIDDIYNQVRTQDDTWVTIPKDNYIRVTFEKTLDNTRDITIYARPSSLDPIPSTLNPSIEVYPVYADQDGNLTQGSKLELIADSTNPDFSNIDHPSTNSGQANKLWWTAKTEQVHKIEN
jgi:hypothetical protein